MSSLTTPLYTPLGPLGRLGGSLGGVVREPMSVLRVLKRGVAQEHENQADG